MESLVRHFALALFQIVKQFSHRTLPHSFPVHDRSIGAHTYPHRKEHVNQTRCLCPQSTPSSIVHKDLREQYK